MEKNKLTAYALNELNETEMKEVEAYLSGHPEVKSEVEEIKLVSQILKSELSSGYQVTPPPFKEARTVFKGFKIWHSRSIVYALSFCFIGVVTYLSFQQVNLLKSSMPEDVTQQVPLPLAEKESTTVSPIIADDTTAVNSAPTEALMIPSAPPPESMGQEATDQLGMALGKTASFKEEGRGSGAARKGRKMGLLLQGDPRTLSGSGVERSLPDRHSESYVGIVENGFIEVLKEPLSTFSIDVDTASYTNARRFLSYGQLPPKDAIRSEEFINYFDYDYELPVGSHPISINMEAVTSPWDKEKVLVKVGLKAKEISPSQRPRSNLVFLIDVSGSMSDENKLPLVKSAMRTLAQQMSEQDKISIVVYAGQSGVVLDATSGINKDKIIQAINNLSTGGGTNGEGGIRKAYEIAQKNFISDGNNRVLLATDGDFNVGVTSSEDLLKIINDKSENGIYLTVLGFGMGNYKDAFLEKISNKGQGNYFYIDNENEANKVFITQLAGTLYTLAKDVKIQVEFNPHVVSSYRLIGYENRSLNKEDFNNDKIDAGELGAGHSVTALYELILKGKEGLSPGVDKLKYQKSDEEKEIKKVSPALTSEILTAKFRYKKPKNTSSEYFDQVLKNEIKTFEKANCSTKFAAAVAGFSQWLRDSSHINNFGPEGILKLSENCLQTQDRKDKHKEEFVELVKKARDLRK